ncbi:BrnT family toxin [Duganella radicis]|uniref:BrnT family toxin n=1 Tax=Duganella radicis TaxID=551988 RepID=A0A6L6PNF5_9BURK|nr:BrnT family toxin [Duganella radicis]MTV40177.1 BrnT family toxin [Duganella radicis]
MITWDEKKRIANLKKHGVDFADLGKLFDRFMYSEEDTSAHYDEVRVKSLCWHEDRVVRLIWIDRNDSARLISCRKATNYETRTYFENAPFN